MCESHELKEKDVEWNGRKNEIVKVSKCELLDIFIEEEDRKGTDLLAMSDFFDVLIGKIDSEMDLETTWEISLDIEGIFSQLAAAIKGVIFQR